MPSATVLGQHHTWPEIVTAMPAVQSDCDEAFDVRQAVPIYENFAMPIVLSRD
eukprot:SAG31_NODE_721_length_12587_cov_5.502002_9_plen_53_part_00